MIWKKRERISHRYEDREKNEDWKEEKSTKSSNKNWQKWSVECLYEGLKNIARRTAQVTAEKKLVSAEKKSKEIGG